MGKVFVELFFEIDCEVFCCIQEKLLIIKNYVVMVLENIGKYRVNGFFNFNVWVEKIFDVVVKFILFEKIYVNMLVNFLLIVKEIKDVMIKRVEIIGYFIKYIVFIFDRQFELIECFYEINYEVFCYV